jgi:hypothetical protein
LQEFKKVTTEKVENTKTVGKSLKPLHILFVEMTKADGGVVVKFEVTRVVEELAAVSSHDPAHSPSTIACTSRVSG